MATRIPKPTPYRPHLPAPTRTPFLTDLLLLLLLLAFFVIPLYLFGGSTFFKPVWRLIWDLGRALGWVIGLGAVVGVGIGGVLIWESYTAPSSPSTVPIPLVINQITRGTAREEMEEEEEAPEADDDAAGIPSPIERTRRTGGMGVTEQLWRRRIAKGSNPPDRSAEEEVELVDLGTKKRMAPALPPR